jgi:CubicO group peptidase (beta-lactamase class C family)
MSLWKIISRALILVVPLALFIGFRPDHALHIATALVAHEICTKTFVSGFTSDVAFAETMARPRIRRLKWVMRYSIDNSASVVQASLLGWARGRAAFHDGLGCLVLHESSEPYLLKTDLAKLKAPATAPLLAEIAGPAVVHPPDGRLKDALDQAFVEPAKPPYRRTKAVVVVRDGTVIAERYAPGVGVDTPLTGFSMTKSVVNGLIGILVLRDRLTISQPAPIKQWQDKGDPRHEITTEQLMRMTSGLALDEVAFGFDAASQMLYLHNDMLKFAASAAIVASPGTRWAYSSPSTNLLAGIISSCLEGEPERTLEFAWRELFNPLGMRDVTLEFDAAGTLIGSMHMSASARDWARFGLLYLYDGVIAGRRILPEGWIAASATATLDTDYGAGFWTNRTDNERAKSRVDLGIPRDAFYAYGGLGQMIIILPHQSLVIVRLGDADDENEEMGRLARLVNDVIMATQR